MEERQEKFPPPPNIIQTPTLFKVLSWGYTSSMCSCKSVEFPYTFTEKRHIFNNPVLQVIALLDLYTMHIITP